MRIGFDAKWFYSGHPSGRVFTRNILRRMIRDYPDNQYIVFLNSEDRTQEFPFPANNVELVFGSLSTNLLSNIVWLPLTVQRTRLDVLITQNFSSPIRGVPQITIVFDIIFKTDPHFFTLKERVYFSFIKPCLRFADAVVTISEYAREEMKRSGFLPPFHSCHVLHLGVDEKFFVAGRGSPDEIESYRMKWGLPERFVLYVGRLNQRKNLDNLVRSMLHLRDQSTKLVVCGARDWKMFDIDALIDELKISERVLYIGHVNDADLPLLYRCATVFAFVPHKEGFGLPPLEAMASGTPVVVSVTSSLPEVCGDAAEYVNPDDPEDIARGLERVLTNTNLQKEMIVKGTRRAKQFTWEAATNRLMNIVKEVYRGQLCG